MSNTIQFPGNNAPIQPNGPVGRPMPAQGQLPHMQPHQVQIQLEPDKIFVSIRNVRAYMFEKNTTEARKACRYCSTLPVDANFCDDAYMYFEPDKSLLDILKIYHLGGSAQKIDIGSITPPLDVFPQTVSAVFGANEMFASSVRNMIVGFEEAKSTNPALKGKELAITDTFDRVVDYLNTPALTMKVSVVAGCKECKSEMIFVGNYAPTEEEAIALTESINKQVERYMFANGIRTQKQTDSGIILPK